MPRLRLDELAPLVLAAAAADTVAAEIVDRQADEIVTMSRAALTRLDLLHESVEVVLGGGLLQSGNGRLLDRITAGLHEADPALAVKPAESPPVVGSALLGLDELRASPEAKERVRGELGVAVAGFEARDATR